ncbi:hypothetical protein UFOVP1636_174 [uncultured Caudovirales phage]|uniref:Uncharacterized protein n=1 Tax=uncultured Caudovirales phage TaxID=2100421 RepID=A0A6J5T0F8_9CAUD|nr:hypothetical protein UFOVP1636_174 [uncultured Caudovirales phage]
MMQSHETIQPGIQGFIKISDVSDSSHPIILVEKKNAIHYENISEALAMGLANKSSNFIYEMHFGNGGTTVDQTGIINYLPPNVNTQNSNLYSPTFFKTVDDTNETNTDPIRNKLEVRHIPGTVYSDILVTCLLDYGEPAGQLAFDNSPYSEDTFVFDELGLKGWSATGAGLGKLLTHVIFHPVQKSLNRLIQIEYTVRIQSLTNLTGLA